MTFTLRQGLTSHVMNISVIDSASMMRRVLGSPDTERETVVRELWKPMSGMYWFMPGEVDLLAVHQQSFGFPIDGSAKTEQQLRTALDALEKADTWTRLEHAVHRSVEKIKTTQPTVEIPDIKVLLMLGDPTDTHFMNEVQGLSGMGGISGYIVITIWPNEKILNRLEAIIAHELHHNIRYSPSGVVWNPATVTVGEHVISEGLADIFAAELYGDSGYTHFVDESVYRDDDVLAKVVSGLNVTGMEDFAAWVLGDATAKRFGGTPVGLPTGAGYATGARLVRSYLEQIGTNAAASIHTPAAMILSTAVPHFGLKSIDVD